MKVKMIQGMVGPDTTYNPGDVVEVKANVGAAWIAAQIAEPVKPTTRKATAEKRETRAKK